MTQACACGRTDLPPDAKFCPSCGAALGGHTCACGASLSPTARFCHKCGKPASGAAAAALPANAVPLPANSSKMPWIVAGVTIVTLLGLIVWRAYVNEAKQAPTPVMGNAGNAQPGAPGAGGPPAAGAAPFAGPGIPTAQAPDISNLTPQQRFARLFNRVMMAGERGDTATVSNFTPMALGAYEQLPTRDAGDRFDAGLLHLQIGNMPAALALADSIRQMQRTNLLGDALLATIARAEGSAEGELSALRGFSANWTAEQQAKRPEYEIRSGLLQLVKARADSIVK